MQIKGKQHRRWTEKEIEYLISNYGKISAKDIANHLNMAESRVSTKAFTIKLKSSRSFTRIPQKYIIEKVSTLFKVICYDKNTYPNIKVICPICNNEFLTLPRRLINGHTKTCGCINPGHRRGTKYISQTFFGNLERNAKRRNIIFQITIDQLELLLVQQNFVCKLSNLPISAIYNQEITASVDRIDSDKGYLIDNIQFLHKDINMAKQSFNNDYFINLCSLVSRNKSANE